MRVIIAGSRDITDYALLLKAIDEASWDTHITVTTVISGAALGVDKMGERYATEHGLKLEVYAADWIQHGRSAGYKRNVLMAQKADALIALWDGKSRGTMHMIDIANRNGLKVYVETLTNRKEL